MRKPSGTQKSTIRKTEGMLNILLSMIMLLFLSINTIAQTDDSIEPRSEFKQAFNFCPGGLIFGIYAANYEYLIDGHHGLIARYDYESIPKTYTDANIDASGHVYMLSYRYHFRGEIMSEHAGVFARYKKYKGNGTLEDTSFDFTFPQYTFGLNGGKRWVWNSGFNLNIMFGYGISSGEREITPNSNAIQKRMDEFDEKYEFDDSFLGEISIGYAF